MFPQSNCKSIGALPACPYKPFQPSLPKNCPIQQIRTAMAMTTLNNIAVEGGVNVFYRAEGSPSNPIVLLLHGFPTSSHQYRKLVPILATSYYVLAPDMPGFGFTQVPPGYVFTFAALADTMASFLSTLGISHCIVYLFDYGAPVGFRLAVSGAVTYDAIITQNGNAYDVGFGPEFWAPVMKYWLSNSIADRDAVRDVALTYDAFKDQYTTGVPSTHLDYLDPATWTLDHALASRPGNFDVQLDLLYDYRTNAAMYPQFQKYLNDTRPPLLAIWGENDVAFVPAGAEAYKTDVPAAEVVFLNTGHFALETNLEEIAGLALDFLWRNLNLKK